LFYVILSIMIQFFLIGFRGSGKSALGRGAAEILDLEFIDLDEVFTEKFGDISEFVAKNSWDKFRKKETVILLEKSKFRGICSTGGGIIESEKNRKFLKKQKIIFIDVPVEEIILRLTKKMGSRPQLEKNKDLETEIRENFTRRLPLYQEITKLTFQPDINKTKEENSAKLAEIILSQK